MAKKKTKPARASGSTRMREQGYTVVTLWLSPGEMTLVKQAARGVAKPLATYVRERATAAAAAELSSLSVRVEQMDDDDAATE